MLWGTCAHCAQKMETKLGGWAIDASEASVVSELLHNASSYVEWGAGASTILALTTPGKREVHTIENQAWWCENMLNVRPELQCLVNCPQLEASFKLHCIRDGAQDAGYHFEHNLVVHKEHPQGSMGYHNKDAVLSREQGFHYVRLAGDLRDKFDLLFVDGRWRTACALQSWLLSHESSRVIFHDWARTSYHTPTLSYFDVERVVGRLAVLRPKRFPADPTGAKEAVWKELLKELDNPS